jgi:hypothetical protein
MASQRINAATAIGRARTNVKGINIDFLTRQVWNRAAALRISGGLELADLGRLTIELFVDYAVMSMRTQ